MRFTFGLPLVAHPQNPEFLTAEAVGRLARAAEAAGFEAVSLTEHPMPNDAWLESGGHDALDPFIGLAIAAATTSTIRLQTNLTPLPYRNPAILAKTVATLDRLSGGRMILGVGVGYLKEEFDAVGADFDERNELFDESLEVMRLIWTGNSVTYRGRHFDIVECTAHPVPVQADIPVWIGGNSALSRRRVAERAHAWMPLPNPRKLGSRRRSAHLDDTDDLRRMIDHLDEQAASVGRTDPIDIVFSTAEGGRVGEEGFDAGRHLAVLHELADLGVTWAGGNVTGGSVSEIEANLGRYGDEVISQYR